MLKIALFVVVAGCIVAGQFFLATFARSLTEPFTPVAIIVQSIYSVPLYISALSYCVGLALYLVMLRRFGLAEATVPLIILVMGLNLLVSHVAGDHLSTVQWAGAGIALIGLFVMLHG